MHKTPGIENIPPSQALQHINSLLQQAHDAADDSKNDFPLSVFPAPIQQIVTGAHVNLNYPVDFTGAAMLCAASVAIGNTFKVQVKRGFQENAVLYLAIVARAGTNKSHPLTFAMQPIINNDKKAYAEYEQQKLYYERNSSVNRKERNKQSDDEPLKPVWQKMLVSDFTPEALVDVHQVNKRGIGVYIDELAGWFKNFNRYNQGSEMEFWLSAWSGKPINIDRKTGDPVFIPTPFISVAGTIQNAMLTELAGQSRNKNGFMDRILFVIPDNLQKPYWTDTEINPTLIENWNAVITELLNIPVHVNNTLNPEPHVLQLSPEAKQILYDWQKQNADQCNQAETEAIAGIYSKLEIYAVRLALILELLNWACESYDLYEVSATAMQGALQLVEYFKRSAVKVHGFLGNTNPLAVLQVVHQMVYKDLPKAFTTEEGVRIAQTHNMPERNFYRFLKNKDLFKHVTRGEYEKLL